MAEILLKNQGLFDGTYVDGDLAVESTIAETTLIDGLTATKTADKEYWTNGLLTYTVTLVNNCGVDFTTPIFTDTLDKALITLVDNSVTVDGVTATYTIVDGLLTVELETLADGATTVITFQVQRV